MVNLDTWEWVIDASSDKVKKHPTWSEDFKSNTNEDHDNDENVDSIIGRLVPTPSQTNSSDAIGPDGFVIMSFDRSSDRAQKKDSIDAMDVDVTELKKRNFLDDFSASHVPSDGIVFSGQFDLVLKGHGTPSEKDKVLFVARGHTDQDEPYIVHNTATLRAFSIRVILSAAVYHEFRIFPHDVTEAFFQSKQNLTRKIFIRIKKVELKSNAITGD